MQVNSIFHVFWLLNLEVISKVLPTSNQVKKISDHFVSVLSDVKLFLFFLISLGGLY